MLEQDHARGTKGGVIEPAPSRQNSLNPFASGSLGGAPSVQPRGARPLAGPPRGSLSEYPKSQNPNVKGVFTPLALFAFCLALGLSGCSSTEKKVFHAQAESRRVENKIRQNEQAQRERLKSEIFAVSLLLENAKAELGNPELSGRALGAASGFNNRAQSLAGMPNVGEMDTVRKLVLGLLSENAELRSRAQKAEAKSVDDIRRLQDKAVVLQHELGIKREASDEAGAKAAGELGKIKSEVNSWFGLAAIGYGLKRFATYLAILVVVVLIALAVMLFFPALAPFALNALAAIWHGFSFLIVGAFRLAVNGIKSLIERFRK